MIRLKEKHRGASALMIFGGPSLVERKIPLDLIDKNKFTVFLESKSLSPYFLKFGLIPDYFLMFYAEKCRSNSLQQAIFQSFFVDLDLSGLLKDEFLKEYLYIRDNFDNFFESWKPERGLHKKYRYKENVYFKDSPFDLLGQIKDTPIISYAKNFKEQCRNFNYPNPLYQFDAIKAEGEFNIADYFNPIEAGGVVTVRDYRFLNSAAIALFPLLNYMGFKKVYFLGMDMSMLGSMEYAAYFTFKSMRHYARFFKHARPVFNFAFKENKRKFMRPPDEFVNLKKILDYSKIEFVNIYEPFEYALPVEGIKNITFKEFLYA